MADFKYIPAMRSNYGSQRKTSQIKYIVIHYTANDGDKAVNNGNFYKNNNIGASAHYFVDDNTIVQSVQDNYIAYAVGGSRYNTPGGRLYKVATNTNSLSIELCDTLRNGTVAPTQATMNIALDLVRSKMKEYGVPKSNVIRHYDVNGKPCPAYWVDDNRWKNEFWDKIDAPAAPKPLDPVDNVDGGVYRIYNPNSDEHFFTITPGERDALRQAGWTYEGVAWKTVSGSSTAVWRMYNPNSGDHFFTMNKTEVDGLTKLGWKYEGIAFYSDDKCRVPIYRLLNPHTGRHHFTAIEGEKNALATAGWYYEGIGFYGSELT